MDRAWLRVQRSLLGFVLACTPSLIWLPSSHAEWYVAGYGGVANPDNIGNASITQRFQRFGAVSAARVIDIDLQNSIAFGAKAGYFFEQRKYLGLAADIYTATPNMKQQFVIVGTAPTRTNSSGTFATVVPGAHIRVTTLAFNVIARDANNQGFEPYGGAGPAFFWTQSKDFPAEGQIRIGLSLIAGARFYLTDHLAPFGEFKLNTATISFGGFSGNYSTQLYMFGLSYHF